MSGSSTNSAALTQAQFNALYMAAQPPAIRALFSMPVDNASPAAGGRTNTALTLAMHGYAIDTQIAIWGWDPFEIMTLRQQFGYTWVPGLLSAPVQMAPGSPPIPGLTPYDPNNPPAGSIKVSLNPADYPPFNPPAPPAQPPTSTSLVGIYLGANDENPGPTQGMPIYSALAAANGVLKDGQEYSGDPRGPFVFRQIPSPFNPNGGTMFFGQKTASTS